MRLASRGAKFGEVTLPQLISPMPAKLPDYLAPNLRVVFCGTAAGMVSAASGHYYAGPGNLFWAYLYSSGITSEPLVASMDHRVLEFGVGLTDLAKTIAASSDRGLRPHYDVEGFVAKIEQFRPTWVAFHGKEAAKAVSRAVGNRSPISLGVQPWSLAITQTFVVPSSSAAHRDASRLEGKRDRVEWFSDEAR
jgi:double-stranded uracil-DNA glycosylase